MVNPTLKIIVPSHGRPQNAVRLLERVAETSPFGEECFLSFAVDFDDLTLSQYPQEHTYDVSGGDMVRALNEVAIGQAKFYNYIAFLGDDTLPHDGWYSKIMEALTSEKNSVVYGNDLIHGQALPTSVFMDSNIINTLGYMAPSSLRQLFVDNYWKALGECLGTLIYVEDAVIEHLHPIANKAPSDASYEIAYSSDRWKKDEDGFNWHMQNKFLDDLEKLT